MPYRQLLRLTTLTAFVLFIHTSALYAQRARNTVLYNAADGARGEITGKITSDAGPLDGVRVALSHGGKVIIDIITGVNGTYNFKELTPGKYDISLFKTGYRKRIIYEIPVIENFLTRNDLVLSKLNNWQEERKPVIQYYQELKDNKIEKMK